MGIEELKNQLDRMGWLEQTDQEITERPNISSDPSPDLIYNELSKLASSVDNTILGELEMEEGYLVWTLRLAMLAEPAYVKQRTQLYMNIPDCEVQYWALKIVREI